MSIICESQLDQVTHVLNLIISAFSPTLIFFFKIAGPRSERIRSLEHLLYLSCAIASNAKQNVIRKMDITKIKEDRKWNNIE